MNEYLTDLEKYYKKSRGILKEDAKIKIERCMEVKDNMTVKEMETVWYLRHLKFCSIDSFMHIARNMYRMQVEFEKSFRQ